MKVVTLAHETDFEGWRRAARALASAGTPPDAVAWNVGGQASDLFAQSAGPDTLPEAPQTATFTVPRAFVDLCRTAILHRDRDRFALLYRLLRRLGDEPRLLQVAVDADVARVHAMVKAVDRDMHKMKAFLRFREIDAPVAGEPPRYVAWFEPGHHILRATAPFFARRFAGMRWSIFTPEASAFWDGSALSFGPGAQRDAILTDDGAEDLWRVYYRSIFNPARLNVAAMRAHMPRRYWRNLPEAELIRPLVDAAARQTGAMVDQTPAAPRKPRLVDAGTAMARRPEAAGAHDALAALAEEARACRACSLCHAATQTVCGEGPADARLMLIGEQPGDQEDLSGRPFVGPAGRLLDQALREAGIDRGTAYVTNAVKHFKFERRGKRRLHATPDNEEIAACSMWLRREIEYLRPAVIVTLGASAARAVLGVGTPVTAARGRLIDIGSGRALLLTVHPAYLLRLADTSRADEYVRFVQDLSLAAATIRDAAGEK